MASPPEKNVVFDVVGTLVSFDAFYDKIEQCIGARLRAHSPPINSAHFGFTWKETAELEFTFLLQSGRYVPYNLVFSSTFYRCLFMAGIAEPREFATEEERDECVKGYGELGLRDGVEEMLSKLRSEGWGVWCLTSGDRARVHNYFSRASLGHLIPIDRVVSCEEFLPAGVKAGSAAALGAFKPSVGAYKNMLKRLPQGEKWFAAAHMWDVSAAVHSGFRGAYCSIYEKEACSEIFADTPMCVTAPTLISMATGIVEKTRVVGSS